MDKKILISSIIAVVILVLVSFTGVVGYQTTKSTTIAKASPLFSIRTSRAIDEESKDLTCDYVGKGEEINIPIPKRNSYGIMLARAINRLQNMDKEILMRFINELMENREILMVNLKHNIKSDYFADDLQIGLTDSQEYPSIIKLTPKLCLIEIIEELIRGLIWAVIAIPAALVTLAAGLSALFTLLITGVVTVLIGIASVIIGILGVIGILYLTFIENNCIILSIGPMTLCCNHNL